MNTTVSKKEANRLQAVKRLKQLYKLHPSGKILIFITHVSQSGMTRRMKVYHNSDNITFDVASLCGLSLNDRGIKITGCGMDMTFWLAGTISYHLWEHGVSPSKRPRSYRGNGGTCIDWQAVY